MTSSLTQPIPTGVAALERATTHATTSVRVGRWDALTLGIVALAVGVAWSWVPSVWYDEAATVGAATRDWDALWAMLRNVDAVHGAYYALMHVWFDLVGYSPFTLRLPSAIAGAVAVWATVELTRRIATRRLAILAGGALIALPRMTWAMAEGRSYAMTIALTMLTTIVLLVAAGVIGDARRQPPSVAGRLLAMRWWALYAVLAVLSMAIFAYLAFVVAAHALTMLLLWASRRVTVREVLPFVIAAAAACIVIAPLLLAIKGQAGQVSWIGPIGPETARQVVVTQFFPFAKSLAIVGWGLIVTGAAVLVIRILRPASRSERRTAALTASIALPLLIVPVVGLVVASELLSPLYSPRYLTFTLPAAAVLIGVALDAIRPRVAAAVVALVALVMTVPVYAQQHEVESKQESSWAEVAQTIETVGDAQQLGATGVVYGSVAGHPNATQRLIAYTYPEAFEGLADPTITVPLDASSELWESEAPLTEGSLDGLTSVWVIESDRTRSSDTPARMTAAGFRITAQWHMTRVNLVLYQR